jgi:hypothetical protein
MVHSPREDRAAASDSLPRQRTSDQSTSAESSTGDTAGTNGPVSQSTQDTPNDGSGQQPVPGGSTGDSQDNTSGAGSTDSSSGNTSNDGSSQGD